MRIFIILLTSMMPFYSLATEGDWIARSEINTMRTTDIVWLNNQGDIYWSSSLFSNAMPCHSKIENEELIEFTALIDAIPRVRSDYTGRRNSQCKDGLTHSVVISFEKSDGTFERFNQAFPKARECQSHKVDLAWENFSNKLYSYTSNKFEACRGNVWR